MLITVARWSALSNCKSRGRPGVGWRAAKEHAGSRVTRDEP
jgi:hypothetical protein